MSLTLLPIFPLVGQKYGEKMENYIILNPKNVPSSIEYTQGIGWETCRGGFLIKF